MEWTQVFVILGVFAAFFVYLLTIVMDIRDRLSRIEGQLMPKVIHFQEEKPKKKAKGE